MDRNLLRKKAKEEYKKMMKTTPKNRRVPFAQMFPILKASIENKLSASEHMVGNEVKTEAIPTQDDDLVHSMLEDTAPPHVHTADCQHEH